MIRTFDIVRVLYKYVYKYIRWEKKKTSETFNDNVLIQIVQKISEMFRAADRRASDFSWVTNHPLRFYDVAVNWIVPVNSSAVGITEEIGCILRKHEM